MKKAKLALEDGTVFEGESFGAEGETSGEVVFNTSLSGYQEVLTDPSYAGQIVTMTYPIIGNYGINREDIESRKLFINGFVVREYSNHYSNWRAELSLHDYLKENNIVGIQDIDTRALTRRIRSVGAMRGIISTEEVDDKQLVQNAQSSSEMIGSDLVKNVVCETEYSWKETTKPQWSTLHVPDKKQYKVIAIDFGIKYNILRLLHDMNCQVSIVPAATSSEEILAYNPDGIFLSNGPGDPDAVKYGIKTVRELLGKKPMFGICLGHQIMALAQGAKTYKLKFGHRGTNHPVKNLSTGLIEITSQNHGFAVDPDSFNDNEVELTHINLNDQTLEGFRNRNIPAFSVQYHPEASPGPHDSLYLFEEFIKLMNEK